MDQNSVAESLSRIYEIASSQIEQAFADVEYPGDDDLTDSLYGDEPEALAREFGGKTDWQLLDAEFLDQAPDGWGKRRCRFSQLVRCVSICQLI